MNDLQNMENQHWIFSPNILPFEQKFIEIFQNSGNTKGRPENLSHVLAYLLIHPKLSQKQIRQLSLQFYQKNGKKGISNGTISGILNGDLQTQKIITKMEETSEDNTIYYAFSGNLASIFTGATKYLFILAQKTLSYFQLLRQNIPKISAKTKDELESRQRLDTRITDICEFLTQYSLIVEKTLDSQSTVESLKNSIPIQKSPQFTTIENCESHIIEYLMKSPLFMMEKTSYSPIFAYFMTRRILNQKQLRTLTNLSMGHISQALNYFLEKDMIHTHKISGQRQVYYVMESITRANMIRFQQIFKNLQETKSNFEDLKVQLIQIGAKLKHENGYHRIVEIVTEILNIFPEYNSIVEDFEVIIPKYP